MTHNAGARGRALAFLTHSSCKPLDCNPPYEEHGGMVVDMQEGDLVVLFTQDEEQGVQELNQLGKVEHPYCSNKL